MVAASKFAFLNMAGGARRMGVERAELSGNRPLAPPSLAGTAASPFVSGQLAPENLGLKRGFSTRHEGCRHALST